MTRGCFGELCYAALTAVLKAGGGAGCSVAQAGGYVVPGSDCRREPVRLASPDPAEPARDLRRAGPVRSVLHGVSGTSLRQAASTEVYRALAAQERMSVTGVASAIAVEQRRLAAVSDTPQASADSWRLERLAFARLVAENAGSIPKSADYFTNSDNSLYFWFTHRVRAGDRVQVRWSAPGRSGAFDPNVFRSSGGFCSWFGFPISSWQASDKSASGSSRSW